LNQFAEISQNIRVFAYGYDIFGVADGNSAMESLPQQQARRLIGVPISRVISAIIYFLQHQQVDDARGAPFRGRMAVPSFLSHPSCSRFAHPGVIPAYQ
jgi:hypothetical protein